MNCPYCHSEKTHVYRVDKNDNVVFRWRKCLECERLFTTEETRSNEQITEKTPQKGN